MEKDIMIILSRDVMTMPRIRAKNGRLWVISTLDTVTCSCSCIKSSIVGRGKDTNDGYGSENGFRDCRWRDIRGEIIAIVSDSLVKVRTWIIVCNVCLNEIIGVFTERCTSICKTLILYELLAILVVYINSQLVSASKQPNFS